MPMPSADPAALPLFGTTAGVDGCPGGWVVATETEVFVTPSLTILDCITTVGIDMPIGLPEDGPRTCDREARAFLGTRRSTVFPTPPRACLDATDFSDALHRSRAATGTGLSLQAFHLLPKIRELDATLDGAPPDHFVEIHPECAFVLLNDGEPLAPKRTPAGEAQRRVLLVARFGPLPPRPRGARRDDLLDAFAVLWSTQRFRGGIHRSFGDGALDGRGRPMRIVC